MILTQFNITATKHAKVVGLGVMMIAALQRTCLNGNDVSRRVDITNAVTNSFFAP